MKITNQARIAITSSGVTASIALLLSYSNERSSIQNQSDCESLPKVATKSISRSTSTSTSTSTSISKPKQSYLFYDTHMFHPNQSMEYGQLANTSSVKHFQIHNMEISVCVVQNQRAYQEDSWIAMGCYSPTNTNLNTNIRSLWKHRWFGKQRKTKQHLSMWKNMSIFGVFDGHGGDMCSKYATMNFERILDDEMYKLEERMTEHTSNIFVSNFLSKSIQRLLEKTILEVDRSFLSLQQQERERERARVIEGARTGAGAYTNVSLDDLDTMYQSGSTAVIVAIHPDSNQIICSNVGDSRAILISESEIIPLSHDHSPDLRPDEVDRIEKLGGIVQSNPMESAYALTMGIRACPRIYQKNGVVGGLNMTRALGDDYLKPLVIPDPETELVERTEEKGFLVLASDGIWDVMSNEEVANVIRKNVENLSPSQFVQSCALKLVKQAQKNGVQDNITCMVIQLPLQKK